MQVGDEVLSTAGEQVLSFSKVIGFLHRDPYHVTTFIHFHTSTNNTLLVTPDHLIFQRHKATRAEDINIGDFVTTVTDAGTLVVSRVTSVDYVNLNGVYAPLTDSGTVVIDGVLSSCYAVLDNHDLAHFAFLPLRLLHKVSDILLLTDYSLGYTQLWPKIYDEVNHQEQNNTESKVHWYAKFLCELTGFFVIICK